MRQDHELSSSDSKVTARVKLLDFLVIGAGKAGTTSLFYYLKSHPKIHMPFNKEAPFFNKDELFELGWEKFAARHFSHASIDGKLWGKITPQYMRDPRVPERVFKQMPEVKLIVLLRNPVDRAFSHYRMHSRSASKPLPPFKDVVISQMREEMLAESRARRAKGSFNSILAQGEYGRILNDFLRYFSREQLLIIFSDDLKRDPQFVLDQVLVYLGLEPGFSPPNIGKRYHVGGTESRFRRIKTAARKLYPVKMVWNMLPEDKRGAIKLWFNTQVKTVQEAPQELPQELRTLLADFYRDDILELEKLIDTKVPWEEFHSLSNNKKLLSK